MSPRAAQPPAPSFAPLTSKSEVHSLNPRGFSQLVKPVVAPIPPLDAAVGMALPRASAYTGNAYCPI